MAGDSELLDRIRGGDLQALSELLVKYKTTVYSYLLLMNERDYRLIERFQDLFLEIIAGSRKRSIRNNFPDWFLRRVHVTSEGFSIHTDESAPPIEKEMAALPVSLRQIAFFRHQLNLPWDQVSRVLKIPVIDLKSSYRDLFHRLRRHPVENFPSEICPQVDQGLVDFLYAEMDPETRQGFQRHAVGCPYCLPRLRSFQNLLIEMDGLPLIEPPESAIKNILSLAPEKIAQQKKNTGRNVLYGAAAAVIVVCGIIFLSPLRSSLVRFAPAKPGLTSNGGENPDSPTPPLSLRDISPDKRGSPPPRPPIGVTAPHFAELSQTENPKTPRTLFDAAKGYTWRRVPAGVGRDDLSGKNGPPRKNSFERVVIADRPKASLTDPKEHMPLQKSVPEDVQEDGPKEGIVQNDRTEGEKKETGEGGLLGHLKVLLQYAKERPHGMVADKEFHRQGFKSSGAFDDRLPSVVCDEDVKKLKETTGSPSRDREGNYNPLLATTTQPSAPLSESPFVPLEYASPQISKIGLVAAGARLDPAIHNTSEPVSVSPLATFSGTGVYESPNRIFDEDQPRPSLVASDDLQGLRESGINRQRGRLKSRQIPGIKPFSVGMSYELTQVLKDLRRRQPGQAIMPEGREDARACYLVP